MSAEVDAHSLWLVRKDLDTAKQLLFEMKDAGLTWSWKEVGMAAAAVDAHLAVSAGPFAPSIIAPSPARKGASAGSGEDGLTGSDICAALRDYGEACAMGYKPAKSAQPEWTLWLQTCVGDATSTAMVPITQEEFAALPARFARLHAPVPVPEPASGAATSAKVRVVAQADDGLLFKYYAAAAWLWCVSESVKLLSSAVMGTSLDESHAVLQAEGVDALQRIRDTAGKVLVHSHTLRQEQQMSLSEQAYKMWLKQVSERPRSASPTKSPTHNTSRSPTKSSSTVPRRPASAAAALPQKLLGAAPADRSPTPEQEPLSDEQKMLVAAERELRGTLTTLQAHSTEIAQKQAALTHLCAEAPDSVLTRATDSTQNSRLFKEHTHTTAVEIARVRVRLGETLLLMAALSRPDAAVRVRDEAVGHLNKAHAFFAAVLQAQEQVRVSSLGVPVYGGVGLDPGTATGRSEAEAAASTSRGLPSDGPGVVGRSSSGTGGVSPSHLTGTGTLMLHAGADSATEAIWAGAFGGAAAREFQLLLERCARVLEVCGPLGSWVVSADEVVRVLTETSDREIEPERGAACSNGGSGITCRPLVELMAALPKETEQFKALATDDGLLPTPALTDFLEAIGSPPLSHTEVEAIAGQMDPASPDFLSLHEVLAWLDVPM